MLTQYSPPAVTEALPVLPVCRRRPLQSFSIQILDLQGSEGVKDTAQQQTVANTQLGMHKASSPFKVYADLDNSSHHATADVSPPENMIKERH